MTIAQSEPTQARSEIEERNKATWLRWVDIADRHALNEVEEIFAPDFVGHDLPPGLPPGP